MIIRFRSMGLLCFLCVVVCSCSRDNEATLYPAQPKPGSSSCDTNNVSFVATVKPILSQNCALVGCHTGPYPTGGYSLDSYTGAKSIVLSGRLIGAITHTVGYTPMPKNGIMLNDCQIGEIVSWVNQGSQNN